MSTVLSGKDIHQTELLRELRKLHKDLQKETKTSPTLVKILCTLEALIYSQLPNEVKVGRRGANDE